MLLCTKTRQTPVCKVGSAAFQRVRGGFCARGLGKDASAARELGPPRFDNSPLILTFERTQRLTVMILTTTPTIEGRAILEYRGVVFGEVISGVNFIRDFKASIRNIVGGRSGSYEDSLVKARTQAMDEMASRAARLGADAVVGIDIDYEVLGENNGMLMVTASGTAVKLV